MKNQPKPFKPFVPHWSTVLEDLSACDDAMAYAKTKHTFAKAWEDCVRYDWLEWVVAVVLGDAAYREIELLMSDKLREFMTGRSFVPGPQWFCQIIRANIERPTMKDLRKRAKFLASDD